MYGTVARMKAKPGMGQQLLDVARSQWEERIPGIVSECIYQADADGDEYWLTVVFESKEAYRKNAESPEQDARYRKLRALMAADPEWHDGEVVLTAPPK
ncbi:MAG TPA: antibiotic biosynthesis monooxygenase [Dehalococcoidia bacterium]|nr:antibiotic biosynthesis monooxygenase [Dehalococcoidia bacterium]